MSVTKLKKAGITFENAQEKICNKKDLNLQEIRVLLQKLNVAGISPATLDLIVKKIVEEEEEEARASRRKVDDSLVEGLIKERETLDGVENFSMITPEEVEKLVRLKKAGVCFEKIRDISIHDVNFEKAEILDQLPCLSCFPYFNVFKARLQIPQFGVDDSTEHKLHNLIAYEQCHDLTGTYVCNYVYLLNSLIDTVEDVDLLVQNKIIHHKLESNEEVAKLINNLCKNLVISKDCFGEIITKLHEHYSNSWNSSIATFRSVYFNDLWRASSSVVGVAVLILTIISLVQYDFS